MTLAEATQYFGTKYKLMKAIGMHVTNANHWKINGTIPITAQRKIEKATSGALKMDPI